MGLLAHTLCGMQQMSTHFPRLRELRANQAERPSFDSRGKNKALVSDLAIRFGGQGVSSSISGAAIPLLAANGT